MEKEIKEIQNYIANGDLAKAIKFTKSLFCEDVKKNFEISLIEDRFLKLKSETQLGMIDDNDRLKLFSTLSNDVLKLLNNSEKYDENSIFHYLSKIQNEKDIYKFFIDMKDLYSVFNETQFFEKRFFEFEKIILQKSESVKTMIFKIFKNSEILKINELINKSINQ
jgi:hypothetical protein